jgi:hypothetical protein
VSTRRPEILPPSSNTRNAVNVAIAPNRYSTTA